MSEGVPAKVVLTGTGVLTMFPVANAEVVVGVAAVSSPDGKLAAFEATDLLLLLE